MRTSQKIRILKELREIFSPICVTFSLLNNEHEYVSHKGMCGELDDILYEKFKLGKISENDYSLSIFDFGIIRPRSTYGKVWWWPTNEYGHKKRVQCINRAIKRLEK